MATGFRIVFLPLEVQLLQAAENVVVSDETLGRLPLGQFGAGHFHPTGHRCHDSPHDIVLYGENIGQLAVESLGPEVRPGRCVN